MSNKRTCTKCDKAVYFAEMVLVEGSAYHKGCLRCVGCSKALSNGRFSTRGGQAWCDHCYEERFVDSETKEIVSSLETAHDKKLHGSSRALPGLASARAAAPVPSFCPPQPTPPSPPAASCSPRQHSVMSNAVQAGIIGAAGRPGASPRGATHAPSSVSSSSGYGQRGTSTARKDEPPPRNPPKVRFCPHCGAQVAGDARFCSNCGQRIASS